MDKITKNIETNIVDKSFDVLEKSADYLFPEEAVVKNIAKEIIANKDEIFDIKMELQEYEIKTLLPENGGEWLREKGDSVWKPDPKEIPKKPPGNEKTWEEILEPYGKEGIEFIDEKPDFSPFAEGTVEIDDFTEDRYANFTQADEKLAQQWTIEGKNGKEWTPQDIKQYRKENNLTWHERSDMKTMDLVPQEIHGNVPHSGGISEKKNQLKDS